MNKKMEERSVSISVDSVPVVNLLELFRGEMKKLDILVEELYGETTRIKDSWQGKASERTLGGIDDLKKVFDEIKVKNQNYVNFIDSTVRKYKAMDTSQKEFVDTSNGSFDTSFYG